VKLRKANYINIKQRKLRTDSNGEIKNKKKKYLLPVYERLLTRSFYINVDFKDIKDNRMPNEKEFEWIELYLISPPIKDDIYSRNIYYSVPVIIYPNNKYSAANVVIWEYDEGKDETTLKDEIFLYDIFAPFNENEMRIAVELARNNSD
jgi:hypothetical protein